MKFKVIKFPGEKISYIAPTWTDLNQLAFIISKKIIKNGRKFDRIVTLAKGGWPMTRSMVDFLGMEKVASIGVKFYSGIYQKHDRPQIYQDIPEPVTGEKILLFDDVADSGGSLEFVVSHLRKKRVKKITTATLFYKPWSTFKPDYFAATTKAWIIFPYDAVQEGILLLGKKWQQQNLSEKEIRERLKKLGINQGWTRFFPIL